MVSNLLLVPALSLRSFCHVKYASLSSDFVSSGLDELFDVIFSTPIDQLFAQILLYGSSTSFFVEYVAQVSGFFTHLDLSSIHNGEQATFLSAAFYFLFHTTTPALLNWASDVLDGHEKELSWEFDFAFFYSSMISVLAIGIMFAVTVPLILPFIAGFLVLRYYTDKWQVSPVCSQTSSPAPPHPWLCSPPTPLPLLLLLL
eukprot:759394-Hanusia_phi.AAC.8